MAGIRPLSLASSLAASIGSSLGSAGDLAGVLTRSSSSSSSSGGSAELPAVAALQGGPAPRQHGMAAPVPYRTAESISACRLLRNYSSFDGLEVPALHQAAAAADAAASAPPRTGPPPDVLLAALSASLAAQKQARQLQPSRGPQQPLRPTAPLPAPPAAYGARPAFACATCSCAFTDAAAYHEHCASLEHTLNILQCSLALAVPHMPAQAAGGVTFICPPRDLLRQHSTARHTAGALQRFLRRRAPLNILPAWLPPECRPVRISELAAGLRYGTCSRRRAAWQRAAGRLPTQRRPAPILSHRAAGSLLGAGQPAAALL